MTLAGVAPDIDGLGAPVELLTANGSRPLLWFSQFHHSLCHNLAFGLLLGISALLLARRRLRTGPLVLASFHLHLLCDLAGSRGPDGYQWPIPYLQPFSHACDLTWSGQWPLNAWPNVLLTLVLVLATLYLARQRGHSPLEIVSSKADAALVTTLRSRIGNPRPDA